MSAPCCAQRAGGRRDVKGRQLCSAVGSRSEKAMVRLSLGKHRGKATTAPAVPNPVAQSAFFS